MYTNLPADLTGATVLTVNFSGPCHFYRVNLRTYGFPGEHCETVAGHFPHLLRKRAGFGATLAQVLAALDTLLGEQPAGSYAVQVS